MSSPTPVQWVVASPQPGVKYRCPCCKYKTLNDRGGFGICPVCYWEDDGQDEPDAELVLGGPNHDLSLRMAQKNFKEFGAVLERLKPHTRPPTPEET